MQFPDFSSTIHNVSKPLKTNPISFLPHLICNMEILSIWTSESFYCFARVWYLFFFSYLYNEIIIKLINPFPNKPWFLRVFSRGILKTLWEKEQFLLFPQCFLTLWRTFCHFHQIQNCPLQTLSIWKSLKFVVWERVNPLTHNPKIEEERFCQNSHFLVFSKCFLFH